MSFEKKWIEKKIDEEIFHSLQEKNFSKSFKTILSARKILKNNLEKFLQPQLKNLRDPFSFAGMNEAVDRIMDAIKKNETIGVFGDYDVDGVCSTAILCEFFSALKINVKKTLPNRMSEGYGLSKQGVERLKSFGAQIIITADCGILAHENILYAKSLGLDVIVIDHHTVGETLPDAVSVINPKRADCNSKADFLCAAGVSFFFCVALRAKLREINFFANTAEPDLRELLDLVALATVCDVVPLVEDNRVLVKAGLKKIAASKRLGLNSLIEACAIDKQKISSTNLGFHLGPRINAAGRLEDATAALDLMLTKNAELAKNLAWSLEQNNCERKELEKETVEQVCKIIESDEMLSSSPIIVVHDEKFHPGVVGIVASRIAEKFHKPAIIIGEKGKGSGRSIRGIDLHAWVSKAAKSLAGFGGHAHAIGVTLGEEGVEQFRKDLCECADANLIENTLKKEIYYDAEINLSEANLKFFDQLKMLEPYGAHNPSPVLRINNCFVRNLRRLNGGHIKGELENNCGSASFIGFRMDMDDSEVSDAKDFLVVLEKNIWQERVSAQLRIIDHKKSLL